MQLTVRLCFLIRSCRGRWARRRGTVGTVRDCGAALFPLRFHVFCNDLTLLDPGRRCRRHALAVRFRSLWCRSVFVPAQGRRPATRFRLPRSVSAPNPNVPVQSLSWRRPSGLGRRTCLLCGRSFARRDPAARSCHSDGISEVSARPLPRPPRLFPTGLGASPAAAYHRVRSVHGFPPTSLRYPLPPASRPRSRSTALHFCRKV